MPSTAYAVVATTIAVWLLAVGAASAWPFQLQMRNRLSVENALHEHLERFRRQMPCGIDGGPPLAPFRLEELDLTYSMPGTIE